ncbi:MAG: WecB/TagA/CpsF family glycosyltransferase [Muribaculaceae bacterium]|nr:WecB/TagA/CpsF family glycosyltransferase [Muribaculaceae bacterium]
MNPSDKITHPSFPERVSVHGVRVYPFEGVDELIDFADREKGILVAVNAEKIVNANERTLPIFNGNIAYLDGAGAVMAARQKGADKAVKIAGCELWLHIISRFHDSKTFYIVGAKPEVHDRTIEKLRKDFPDINIVGHRDGYLKSDTERQALIDDVADKKPDVVFVAMGSPKQEILMNDMLQRHRAIYQGLGGSFDVYTGNVPRAPKWWLDHNLEFAYRLIKQPSRIKRDVKYLTFAWWLLMHKF